MVLILAAAWADALGTIDRTAVAGCMQWSTGVRCTRGTYEINVRTQRVDPSSVGSARVDRFLGLLDWPRCRFDVAWLDNERGWQAQCDDGERAWIGRWWVLEGEVLSQTVAGPSEGLGALAEHWFDQIAFRGRTISAPRLR